MTFLPFICLGAGFLIGVRDPGEKILKITDGIVNFALIVLMLTIGMNVGINQTVIMNLGTIGLNCLIISLLAVGFSIILIIILEKTILPLEKLQVEHFMGEIDKDNSPIFSQNDEKKSTPLIWIMPASILVGAIYGYFFMPESGQAVLDSMLRVALIILYTGVGVSLGSSRKVFQYIKQMGWKVLYISAAILAGSLAGGLTAGLLLDVSLPVSVMSAGGMSYYSLTGAYMTQACGIEAGTYGFIVNVMREFFTVLFLPLLVRISKGGPIAGGAAGNMDTMLVPVTKTVGAELGLVALITGVILTLVVPFLLPFLNYIL